MVDAGDEANFDEEVASIEEELIVGKWQGPFSNGDAGPNPMTFKQKDSNTVVYCQVYRSDGRWHPGKLWAGQCRYDYNGAIGYASTYHALQKQSGLSYVPNPGYTPANAISSSNGPSLGGLPVCSHWMYGTGKVWQGTCRISWDGKRFEMPYFDFLVKN